MRLKHSGAAPMNWRSVPKLSLKLSFWGITSMSDRFSPDSKKVKRLLKNLGDALPGDPRFLVDAFESATGTTGKTANDVKNDLLAAVMSKGTPWILYEPIRTLLSTFPLPRPRPIIR